MSAITILWAGVVVLVLAERRWCWGRVPIVPATAARRRERRRRTGTA